MANGAAAAAATLFSVPRPSDLRGQLHRAAVFHPVASPRPFLPYPGSLFLAGRPKRMGGGRVRPVVRAQVVPGDYVPDAKFYKIEAILRPWRVTHVSSELLKMGIRGVTISDVKGFGAQGGSLERHAGSEFSEDNFVAKTKMEIILSKDQVEAVIQKIIEEARTGEIGDGKIFLMPVSDVIRVRTGERGEKAEKMTGGRSDMISSVTS